MTSEQDIVVSAADGYELAATLFTPIDTTSPMLIVNSATAVPRQFYRAFGKAAAAAGFPTLTYDYRGIGASKPTSLRGFDASMRDWALLDMQGVVDWASHDFGSEGVYLVGHSVGGQLAGLLENASAVRAMATFSAQSGHWRLQGGEQKWVVALHVYLTLPLLAKLCGFVPWSKFSSAEDLPQGVALEWSRWCRDPSYALGDASLPLDRFAAFSAPVLAYSIEGDKWGTQPAVDAMMRAYPNLTRMHIVPADHGIAPLGHMGFFRERAGALWPDVFEYFAAR